MWRGLEPATLLRALAMIFIVARHTGAFEYSKEFGAGILLFALGGYALARFQLPEIIRQGSVRSILGTALLVAIPTILVAGPTQVMTHTFFEPQQFLMISNFFDPVGSVADQRRTVLFRGNLFPAVPAGGSAVFLARGTRVVPRTIRWPARWACSSWHVVLKFAVDERVGHALPVPARAAELRLELLPWHPGGLVRTTAAAPAGAALVVACSYFMWGSLRPAPASMPAGWPWCCSLPTIRVPAIVKTVIGEIAAGSIFIYLVHFQVRDIVHQGIRRAQSPGSPWLLRSRWESCARMLYGYAQRAVGSDQVSVASYSAR